MLFKNFLILSQTVEKFLEMADSVEIKEMADSEKSSISSSSSSLSTGLQEVQALINQTTLLIDHSRTLTSTLIPTLPPQSCSTTTSAVNAASQPISLKRTSTLPSRTTVSVSDASRLKHQQQLTSDELPQTTSSTRPLSTANSYSCQADLETAVIQSAVTTNKMVKIIFCTFVNADGQVCNRPCKGRAGFTSHQRAHKKS